MWRRIATGAFLVASAIFVHATTAQSATAIDYKRSLLIMEPEVVSPYHATNACDLRPASDSWSFASLMGGMAGNGSAATQITDWLALFDSAQTVANGQVADARPGIRKFITDPWAKTGYDLTKLPFRLLAILNRVDLRGSPLLSGENDGELRFVFGAVDVQNNCADLPFTVILEYGVRDASCEVLQNSSKDWIGLSGIDPNSSEFLTKLRALTDAVLAKAIPAKPNGSPIDHVRTNEYVDSDHSEMREFDLLPATHRLIQDAVSLTPADHLNGMPALATFLETVATGIEAQDYWVPLFQPGTVDAPLLGAVALPHPVDVPPFWQAPGVDNSTLATPFSGNTCSGCHSLPSANTDFTHIDALLNVPTNSDDGYVRASKFLINDAKTSRCLALCRASEDNGCFPAGNASSMCRAACNIPSDQKALPRRALVH
jgi:hypothetical protein